MTDQCSSLRDSTASLAAELEAKTLKCSQVEEKNGERLTPRSSHWTHAHPHTASLEEEMAVCKSELKSAIERVVELESEVERWRERLWEAEREHGRIRTLLKETEV